MSRAVLALDAGTTGVTCLVVDDAACVVGRGDAAIPQHLPRPGWVEHDPEEIWQAVLAAGRAALDSAPDHDVVAVGVTNQRATAALWDRSTLAAPRPAIASQDRRTTGICDGLVQAGQEARVAEVTGLRLDPSSTATKLAWVRREEPEVWAGVVGGRTAVGTVDSYVVARLTAGARHVTDASNASRTLLLDLATGQWSEELCGIFGVPVAALPEVVASWGEAGRTDPGAFLGLDVPVAGIAGDRQAALVGQACFQVGDATCTYGTGSVVLVNTGHEVVRSPEGLLSTIAWRAPDGTLTYAVEGAVLVTGAAVQWLRDGLEIIATAPESEDVARSVRDSGGLVFVPALTGLGAPDSDPTARGTIIGITRGTKRAHLVRATLEAIAFEVRDVVATLRHELPALRVDGAASTNDLLLQIQADQLGVPVERPAVLDTAALGAAFLAGLGTGVWSGQQEIAGARRLDRTFEPQPRDEDAYRRWRAAVGRAKAWARP